ncbi:Uncharacterised protein [Mycobacteroides abscessus subsp. abscessus]|nr:Uncharacterised protein [Mycobacteroides abscessus subsp. abscessus]
MRCCAGDSGTRSGRRRGASTGSPLGPSRAGTTRAASCAAVGASNRSRSATVAFSAALTRATTLVALSELPPSSKKEWSTLTRSVPSTSANTSATARSTAVRGARYGRCDTVKSGTGRALRSSLPTGVSGTSSSTTRWAGTM